jgi:hypothetical protein
MYRKLGKEIKKAFRRNGVMTVLLNALHSGPFDGGCLVVAKAIVRLVPECKVVTMVRRLDNGKDISDHYAVQCPDGGIIDADGYSPNTQAFIKRFLRNEGIRDSDPASHRIEPRMVMSLPKDDIDDPRAVKDLARELGAAIPI